MKTASKPAFQVAIVLLGACLCGCSTGSDASRKSTVNANGYINTNLGKHL